MAFQNPQRAYRFRVEMDGVDQWAIQKFTLPERSMTVVKHGGGDHDIKTASKREIGDATFEKLIPSDFVTNLLGLSEWMELCLKGIPTAYKRNLVVKLLGNDGLTTVKTYLLLGCFPIKIAQNDLDRMADENSLETLTLSVDEVKEI